MVHILLLILKIIGMVLLILLALILILLLTVLFTPLRCTLKASIDNSPESAQGSVRFHWLFHLISGPDLSGHSFTSSRHRLTSSALSAVMISVNLQPAGRATSSRNTRRRRA